jgi:hypothetical protein
MYKAGNISILKANIYLRSFSQRIPTPFKSQLLRSAQPYAINTNPLMFFSTNNKKNKDDTQLSEEK